MNSDILRDKFLAFFKARKHKIVDSDSLVPKDDPTVLFTPAGMNQFKKQFLGFTTGFTRAATSQRCLRTDDLDKVGKTCGHHTFFEMLGNFSFGDYFKDEAISWAWEFLTEELKIKETKLWVSVYKDDEEAYKIWKDKIKIPEQRIVKLGDKDNFWPAEAKEKGPNGPCGPCSEIFFDYGADSGCKKPDCNPSCSCGRFVEVWNLVFTQFNRKEAGALEALPNKNIDTGMGLERLAAVMQGVKNNFETDLFQPIIKEIYLGHHVTTSPRHQELVYAVSDHIRAAVFAIYDGVLPSNESRGYVVRKLIRKASYNLASIGLVKPFLYKLVPVVSQIMKVVCPDLEKRRENIAEIVLAEEKSFISILKSSDTLLKEKFSSVFLAQDPVKSAELTFELYDTYGVPLELTMGWLKEKFNTEVSQERLNHKINEQKNRSKSQSAMKGDVFSVKDMASGIKETKFLGYKNYECRAKVLRIIKDDAQAKKAAAGDQIKIIFDETVFYPESGGQIADRGSIVKGKNIIEVLDTQKSGKVIIHICKIKAGSVKIGDEGTARVDIERRLSIARNHTATHLLQAALRRVLGVHVQQQGSLVEVERLRFDFTHFKDIDNEQLDRIEEIVNDNILGDHQLCVKQLSLSEAKKTGALAFFGEKYEGKVRVVAIADFSKEFCGGTHLDATGQIGLFKITQEGSVASGVRRIEAVTGKHAYNIFKENSSLINDTSFLLNVPKDKIAQEVEKRLVRIKELEKQLSAQKSDSVKASLDDLIKNSAIVKGVKIIGSVIDNADMGLLRNTVDLIKQKSGNTVIALGSNSQGKALLVIGVTPDLIQKGLDAVKLIRDISGVIGGSGGGRSDFAQAGGAKPENFPEAFRALKNTVANLI